MKGTIQQSEVVVREAPSQDAPRVAVLTKLQEIEIDPNQTVEKGRETWIKISFSGNAMGGWIRGNTKISASYDVVLEQKKLVVFRDPLPTSTQIYTIAKGEIFRILNTNPNDGTKFVHIRTASGLEGYVKEGFHVKKGPRLKKRELMINLLWGFALVGLALLLTFWDVETGRAATSISNARWISLVFGLLKLASAGYQYLRFLQGQR